jgi:hypothetical protein
MLKYLYGYDEIVAKFVATLIPHCRGGFDQNSKTIGVLDEDGRLIAGLVYHNYDPQSEIIELSGAATHPRWLTRGSIARMYQYPFHQCGCQMLVQRTPADNERLLGQLAAYDFHFINIPRMFGRGKDGVLCCLTYENWAANRFNKRLKHHIDQAIALEQEAA